MTRANKLVIVHIEKLLMQIHQAKQEIKDIINRNPVAAMNELGQKKFDEIMEQLK